ncbi:hypothetical protein GCM10009678_72200 [Actinomadura kijaniata]
MPHPPSGGCARISVAASTPADPSAGGFQLDLFDGFRLERAGRSVTPQPAAGRLIAFLGIRGRCSRAEVVGAMWPDVPEERAQASLRTVLWRLRRQMPGLLGGREALAISGTVDMDISRFQAHAWCEVGSAQAALGEPPCPIHAAGSAGLRVGELLPGWYDDWVIFERERLRQLQLHALEALAVRLTAEHRHAEAVDAALAAVRMDPLRESATRALIEAYLAEGNLVEAMRQLRTFQAQLRDELCIVPSPELERLVIGHGSPR